MNDVHNDMDFRESDWEAALGVLEQAEAAQRSRRRKAILWWSTATVAAIVLGVLFLGMDEQTDYIPRTSAVAIGEAFAEETGDVEISETPATAPTDAYREAEPLIAPNGVSPSSLPNRSASAESQNPAAETAQANTPNASEAALRSGAAVANNASVNAASDGALVPFEPQTVDTTEEVAPAPAVWEASSTENLAPNGGGASSSAEGENPVKLPEIANNASILWVEKAPLGAVSRVTPLKLQPVKNARTAGELLTPKLKLRKRFPIPAKTYNLVGYVGNTFAFGYGKVKGTGVVDPALGLTGEIRLINRTWLRTGVGLFQVNNVFSRKEYREEQASFGLSYTSTLISTDRLYMVDLPLGVVIDLNQHHGLVVGTGMEMLLTTRNQLQQRQVTPFSTSVLEERNDFGYRTGYTTMNGYVQLGYRYRVSRRSSFDAVYSTGWRRMHEFNNIRNARLVMRFNFLLK